MNMLNIFTHVLPYFPEPYPPENPWKHSLLLYRSRVFKGLLEIKVLENQARHLWIYSRHRLNRYLAQQVPSFYF